MLNKVRASNTLLKRGTRLIKGSDGSPKTGTAEDNFQ